MLTIYAIISIIWGLGVLYYGLKWFNTSLAFSYLISSLVLFSMLTPYGGALGVEIEVLGFILMFTIAILIFGRFYAYLGGVAMLWGSMYWIWYLLISQSIVTKPWLILGMNVISWILVVIFRRFLKTVVIGFHGGLAIGVGLSVFVFSNINSLSGLSNSIKGFGLLQVVLIVGGIALQYLYVIPNKERIDIAVDFAKIKELFIKEKSK